MSWHLSLLFFQKGRPIFIFERKDLLDIWNPIQNLTERFMSTEHWAILDLTLNRMRLSLGFGIFFPCLGFWLLFLKFLIICVIYGIYEAKCSVKKLKERVLSGRRALLWFCHLLQLQMHQERVLSGASLSPGLILENQDHLSTNNFLCSPRPYGLVRIFCEWETFLFPWKYREIELDVCNTVFGLMRSAIFSVDFSVSLWISIWDWAPEKVHLTLQGFIGAAHALGNSTGQIVYPSSWEQRSGNHLATHGNDWTTLVCMHCSERWWRQNKYFIICKIDTLR